VASQSIEAEERGKDVLLKNPYRTLWGGKDPTLRPGALALKHSGAEWGGKVTILFKGEN